MNKVKTYFKIQFIISLASSKEKKRNQAIFLLSLQAVLQNILALYHYLKQRKPKTQTHKCKYPSVK